MIRTLNQKFTAHPASVDETYFEHMRFAGRFGVRLMAAGCAALVHALLPWMFEKTASGMIRDMYREIANR